MADPVPAPTASVPSVPAAPPAPAPAAPAAPDAGAAMRDRIRQILSSPQGQADRGQAEHLAYNTALSAEDCIGILGARSAPAAPAAAPAAPAALPAPAPAAPPVVPAPAASHGGSGILAEMAAMRHPNLGAAPGAGGAEPPAAAGAPPKPLHEMTAAEREQWEFQDGARTARELLGREPGHKQKSWIDMATNRA